MSEQNSDNSKQENSGGLWARLRRPSGKSLGGLLAVGFVVGVLFWGGFNTALEATNTEKFCISCHEMYDNVYMEYKETIHYNNRTGVRATCPDCHVPKDWTHKMIRKVQASKELWGKMVGTIDTREKFEAKRLLLASSPSPSARPPWARNSCSARSRPTRPASTLALAACLLR